MDSRITTLAIGDGANDVSMIATAHVGIGIRGKEVKMIFLFVFQVLNCFLLFKGKTGCKVC